MSLSHQQTNLTSIRVKFKRVRVPHENPLDIQHKKLKTQSLARSRHKPQSTVVQKVQNLMEVVENQDQIQGGKNKIKQRQREKKGSTCQADSRSAAMNNEWWEEKEENGEGEETIQPRERTEEQGNLWVYGLQFL